MNYNQIGEKAAKISDILKALAVIGIVAIAVGVALTLAK